MVSGGTHAFINKAIHLLDKLDPTCEMLFTCVGVHPTCAKEFEALLDRFDPESGKCLTFAGLQRLGGETPGAVEDWGQMLLCIFSRFPWLDQVARLGLISS